MKLLILIFLIICVSFMVTTIETTTCIDNPIIYDNLDLPVTINLAQLAFGRGFLPDKSIEINGVVLADPDEFVVNLFEDGKMFDTADVPFHFKALFRRTPPYVNRTNWIKNRGWGHQENGDGFRFRAGRTFILEFVAAPKNTIIIMINNKTFANFSRVDLSKISQLYVDGNDTIRVNSLTLCPQVITTATLTPRTTTEKPFPSCLNPIDIDYPELPLTIDLVEAGFGKGFLPNKSIEIYGVVREKPKTFNIYLMEGAYLNADMPFAFQSILDVISPYVLLNNWINSTRTWGIHSRYPIPLRTGQPFSLKFFAAPKNSMKIYINNQYFAPIWRVDWSKISQLYIEGGDSVKLNFMTLCTKSPSPPPPPFCKGLIELNNLTIPSIIDLEEIGFRRGFIYRKLIIIHGTATEPTNFDVSLVEDGVPEETADIPFRFSVDFATKDVITDTWIYGKGWINKQRIERLPFTVGQEFELKFIAESKRHGLHVHVNERHFVSFYRSNLREITQLEIKGAIKVRSVNLCPY